MSADSYETALVAAGATVHAFREFGSYQGDWYARVTLADGSTGWVSGAYGSCSGCDAFEREFEYASGGQCAEHRYENDVPECPDCAEVRVEYQRRLGEFGQRYLDGLMTQEEAEARASENDDWDCSVPEMVEFLKQHAVTVTPRQAPDRQVATFRGIED